MQTTSISVARVYPPKGRGPAAIKDNNGTFFKFWTREIPTRSFQEGGTYQIGYKTELYNGEEQYYIQEVMQTGGAPTPAARPAQAANPNKDEDIAVLAIVKCMGQLPIGDPTVVAHALRTAQSGWRLYKKGNVETGAMPRRSMKDELNDEIPGFDDDPNARP